jgi:hypothetical protein
MEGLMKLFTFPAFLVPAALLPSCEGSADENIQITAENAASAVENFADDAGTEIGNQIQLAENRLQDGNEANSADAENRK